MRTVTIVGISGHLMEIQCEDVTCWEVKCAVKREAGVPLREQKLMWGETMLAPRREIPKGDVTLTLVRVKTSCVNCGRRGRKHLLLCLGCVSVTYCDPARRRSDWSARRKLCCKRKTC